MKPQSLRAVIRLRRLLVEDAGRHLAGCIQAETEAIAAVRELGAEMTRQRQAAEEIDASDADVEAFMLWLGRERHRLDELAAAQDRAAVMTARARAELTAARAALQAVESLQAQAAKVAEADRLRREQLDIDERARRGRAEDETTLKSDDTRDGIA